MAGTKSLGQLTLDMVLKIGGFTGPMDQSGRKLQKWSKDAAKYGKAVGTAFAGAATVVGGAAAAMAYSAINNAEELEKLAKVASVSNREFQRFAAGARTVGIEQDKVSDILKDVNDRVGDFLQTGAGPMADFFEKIAPQVGVTADEFKKLSGPQALGLYVDTLEKAGLNQQEMTFYMEAMAGDTTALLPLLRDGGKGMKGLADEAENLGLILSDTTIEQSKAFKDNLDVLGRVVDSVGADIAADLLPELVNLTDELKDPETVKAAKAMASGVVGAFTEIITGARNVVNFLHWAGEEAAAFMNGIDPGDLVRLNQELERLEDMKNSGVLDRTILFGRDGLIEYYNDAELDAEMAKIRSAIEAAMMDVPKLKTTLPPELLTPPTTDLDGGGTDGGGGSGGGGSGGGAAKEVEAIQSQVDVMGDYMDLVERVGSVVQASWSDQSRALYEYQQQVETLREGLLEGVLNEDQYNATLEALEARNELFSEKDEELLESTASFWEQYLEAAEVGLTDFQELSADVIENFSGSFGSAFESMIFDAESLGDAVGGMAEGMARSIVNALGQMAAQWLAYQAVQLIVGKTTQSSAASTMIANAQATSAQAALAAFASTAAIPIVGPIAAPGAAAAATAVTLPMVAAVAGASLAGMAHDGIDSIPATGSWYLEKGERVTTAETSAKLDATLDMISRDMRGSRAGAGGIDAGGRGSVIQQTIQVTGTVDARTATQIARESERKQRQAQKRLG